MVNDILHSIFLLIILFCFVFVCLFCCLVCFISSERLLHWLFCFFVAKCNSMSFLAQCNYITVKLWSGWGLRDLILVFLIFYFFHSLKYKYCLFLRDVVLVFFFLFCFLLVSYFILFLFMLVLSMVLLVMLDCFAVIC